MFCRLLFDVSFAPLPRRDVVGRSPDADALLLCESLGADVAQFIDRIVAIPRKSRTQHQIGHVVVVARGGDHPHTLRGASALGRHLDAALQDHVVEVFACLVPLRLFDFGSLDAVHVVGQRIASVVQTEERIAVHHADYPHGIAALDDLRLMSFSPSDEFQPQDGQHTHGDRGDQDAVAELPFAAVPAVPPVVTATGCCRVRLFRHSLIEF